MNKSTLMTLFGAVGLGLAKSKSGGLSYGNKNFDKSDDFDVVLHHFTSDPSVRKVIAIREGRKDQVLDFLISNSIGTDSFSLLKKYRPYLEILDVVWIEHNHLVLDVEAALDRFPEHRYFSEYRNVRDIKDDPDFRDFLESEGYEWIFQEDFEDEWEMEHHFSEVNSLDEDVELSFDVLDRDRDCFDLDYSEDWQGLGQWVTDEMSGAFPRREVSEFAMELATGVCCSMLAMDILSFNFDLLVSGDSFSALFINNRKVSEIIQFLDADDFEFEFGETQVRFLNDAPVFQLFLGVLKSMDSISVIALADKLRSSIVSVDVIFSRFNPRFVESYDFHFSLDGFEFDYSFRPDVSGFDENSALLGTGCIVYAKMKQKSLMGPLRLHLDRMGESLLMNPKYWGKRKNTIRSF